MHASSTKSTTVVKGSMRGFAAANHVTPWEMLENPPRIHENPSENLANPPRTLANPPRIHENPSANLRKSVRISENLRKPAKSGAPSRICENPQKSAKISINLQKSPKIFENLPRIHENPSANLRKSIANLCKSSQTLAHPLRIRASTPSRPSSLGPLGTLA